MTTSTFRWARVLVVAVMLPAVSMSAETAAVEQVSESAVAAARRAGAIRGVWDSTITIQVCNGGPTIRTFRALNLFEHDGSLVATSEVAQPPSLGKWRWLGGRKFRATFRFQRFGAGGVFEGVTQVTREIALAPGGTEFLGVVSTEIFDITDTLIAEACGTEVAKRAL